MSRVLQIAKREFVSTALTKGFIIGAFVLPVLFTALIPLVVLLALGAKAPPIVGEVAVIDRSGVIAEDFESRFFKALEERKAEEKALVDEASRSAGAMGGGAASGEMAQSVMDNVLADIQVSVTVLPNDADVDAEKARLTEPADKDDPSRRLAVLVIDEHAVAERSESERAPGPDAGEDAQPLPRFGGFELFVRPKTDDRTSDVLRSSVRESIRDERYATYGYDRQELEELNRVETTTREITETGDERGSTEDLQQMLPLAFMLLMMISIMIGGGYLLTTTVEEKSSRVVEVLLSATSPMQLMAGKILGQMGVGLSLMIIYSGLGMAALIAFAIQDIIDPMTLVYMIVFFLAGYFMIASLMAAVGAAVNDMREAQSLQTPIVMFVIIPYLFWLPISRDPNSILATVLSFLPPASPFIMMMRVVSSDPPPLWEVLLSILVMGLGVYVCLKIAAKVFRVGLLMYGKPPNFRTLVKWVRMA
ncbi:MAG: ABC transporter permease [Phycisphaerales bacterium JB040]